MAEREKAYLFHDTGSLARSDWLLDKGRRARSVDLPFVGKLDRRPAAATEAPRSSSTIEFASSDFGGPSFRVAPGRAQGHLGCKTE